MLVEGSELASKSISLPHCVATIDETVGLSGESRRLAGAQTK
jgi:hypothetical protein